ncbi:hypothetical protein BKA64DRAFT_50592 [Cadophora sp. MPI-SDFR-AT-0126]|nr:hypothetical protein BKA64DRAFT_50592 [Leotiomycetes sp. MPI-SDFR-AT-0126]
MGLFDFHWKGKSKASLSTTNDSINSNFSQQQQSPRWVRTPLWNEAEASASTSSSSSPYQEPEKSETQEKRKGWKSGRGEKFVPMVVRCEHKVSCGLSTPECCACLDRRPLNRDYFIYKDGRGLVAEGTRWGDYCPGCKAYWARRQGRGIPDPSSPKTATTATNLRIAIPSTNSASESPGLKSESPAQQPQPQHQGETNDPPPPYSSALSDGWEILPRYKEADEEYGGRN